MQTLIRILYTYVFWLALSIWKVSNRLWVHSCTPRRCQNCAQAKPTRAVSQTLPCPSRGSAWHRGALFQEKGDCGANCWQKFTPTFQCGKPEGLTPSSPSTPLLSASGSPSKPLPSGAPGQDLRRLPLPHPHRPPGTRGLRGCDGDRWGDAAWRRSCSGGQKITVCTFFSPSYAHCFLKRRAFG